MFTSCLPRRSGYFEKYTLVTKSSSWVSKFPCYWPKSS